MKCTFATTLFQRVTACRSTRGSPQRVFGATALRHLAIILADILQLDRARCIHKTGGFTTAVA